MRTLVAQWLVVHGVRIVVIAVAATIVIRVLHLAIRQLQHRLSSRHASTDLEWQRRTATIGGLLNNLVTPC